MSGVIWRYIGLGPKNIRVGDTLANFGDGKTPYLSRQINGSSSYELIGETYTHGLMDGKVLALMDMGGPSEQNLTIV
jgi:hypothetical protein